MLDVYSRQIETTVHCATAAFRAAFSLALGAGILDWHSVQLLSWDCAVRANADSLADARASRYGRSIEGLTDPNLRRGGNREAKPSLRIVTGCERDEH